LLRHASDGSLVTRAAALRANESVVARFADGERTLGSGET
jgi:hypothetical protein